MSRVVDQDQKARGGVETGNEKEEHSVQDEADFEVLFKAGDITNPKEWSSWRRAWALFCIAFSSFIVSLYSTNYTSSIPGVSRAFDKPTGALRRDTQNVSVV
jgi:hypothetical protein